MWNRINGVPNWFIVILFRSLNVIAIWCSSWLTWNYIITVARLTLCFDPTIALQSNSHCLTKRMSITRSNILFALTNAHNKERERNEKKMTHTFSCSCLPWIWDRKWRKWFFHESKVNHFSEYCLALLIETQTNDKKKIPITQKNCKEYEFRIIHVHVYHRSVKTRKIPIPIATVQTNKERQKNEKKNEILFVYDHHYDENIGKKGDCRHSVSENRTNCYWKHWVLQAHTNIEHELDQKK